VSGPLPPRQGLVAFMATLAGPQPSGFIELRHRPTGRAGMRQRFFDKPQAAAVAATVLSQTGDVYVGCAPRSRRAGGKDAVEHGWVLWVDCDDPQAIGALGRFDPQPAIVVRTSGRGLHAYWPLEQPLPAAQLERAKRRLAYALGAWQSAVTNAAAVLRPPATVSWKYDPPTPVTLARYTRERFSVDQVSGDLRDPPAAPRRRAQSDAAPARTADALLRIAPAVYVEALIGRRVGRDGKVACPFHPTVDRRCTPTPTRRPAGPASARGVGAAIGPTAATSTTSPASCGDSPPGAASSPSCRAGSTRSFSPALGHRPRGGRLLVAVCRDRARGGGGRTGDS
jgi:hypothetical protein